MMFDGTTFCKDCNKNQATDGGHCKSVCVCDSTASYLLKSPIPHSLGIRSDDEIEKQRNPWQCQVISLEFLIQAPVEIAIARSVGVLSFQLGHYSPAKFASRLLECSPTRLRVRCACNLRQNLPHR